MVFNTFGEEISKTNGQSFSATDLAREGDIGIVFPIKDADEDTINIASIVDRKHNDEIMLRHSECREVFSDKDTVEYYEGKSISKVKRVIEHNYTEVEKKFECKEDYTSQESYVVTSKITELTQPILKLLNTEINFKPVVLIDANNLTEKKFKPLPSYKPTSIYSGYGNYGYTYEDTFEKKVPVKPKSKFITPKQLNDIRDYAMDNTMSSTDPHIVSLDEFKNFTKTEKIEYLKYIDSILFLDTFTEYELDVVPNLDYDLVYHLALEEILDLIDLDRKYG